MNLPVHSKTISTAAKITEKKVLHWADKLTTDSKIVKKIYKEKLNVDFEFFYAPLDVKKFSKLKSIEKKEKQVIFIGRDSYEKGIDILKDIESKIDAKVVYCTNTKWEDAMENLKASSILVIPSRMESIPQVIKEAFYLKIPIIATNVGGIPELITNNETIKAWEAVGSYAILMILFIALMILLAAYVHLKWYQHLEFNRKKKTREPRIVIIDEPQFIAILRCFHNISGMLTE